MRKGEQKKSGHDFLAGGGEMGALMRAKDWSDTPLGSPDEWQPSLRSALSICLGSRFPIVIYWGPRRVVLYNDAYAEILGKKHPWALGRPCQEVWSEIWDVIAPMFDSVIATGEATWSEDQLLLLERRGYPEECYFSFSFSPVRGARGEVDGIFTAVIENTRRVVGERRMALLRDLAARTATARTPRDACVLAMQALQADPEDVPFALVYLDTGAGEELQCGTPGAEEALAAAPPGLVRELPLPATGTTGRVVIVLNARRPLDEQYVSFVELVVGKVATAVANARAYEEERRRADALTELDRAKTAFFSNVSHEFRTPLTLMLGPVEDALADPEAPLPPAQRERLEVAHRNALRLQKLVNTLLDFSRIEAGRAQASYLPTQLGALTADLASSFRSAIERAGLRLVVDCPPLTDLSYVDRDMWEKIVLNLISNAVKFTFEGEIAVTLRQKAGRAELTVRDTGTGIAAAELPRVFERFHRIEGAKSRTHEGTGIGLALVRELVKLHGGSIGVESAPGAGTTFTVSIPQGRSHLPAESIGVERGAAATALRAEAFVEEALRWLPGAPAAAGEGAAGRPRILIADDNADLREYVHRLLGGEYRVEAVADGEAALAAARARKPDLVLADVMMPGLDGFGLIRELRADPALRTIPVIVLSARAGEEARLEGLGKGADDYLVKPFSARELLVRVGAMLRSMEIRRDTEAALRQREAQLEADLVDANLLREISTHLIREDNVEALYEKILDAAVSIMQSDFASMQMLHPGRGQLQLLGARGFSEEAKKFWEWVGPKSGSTCALSLQQGKRCMVADSRTDEYLARSGTRDAYLQAGILAMQSTPLLSRTGELIGMITTHWRKPHQAPERDLRLFDLLARQAADVLERNKAQKQLRESAAALHEADRRKDEFLAMLSHELRNPLAPIRNAISLIEEADDEPAIRRQARAILERQVNHMIRLVDDLLDIARISRGGISLRKEMVRIGDIVAAARETSHALIEAGGHRLEVSVPPEPIPMLADRVRLIQVIANLLNNSARYTPYGGRIALTVRADAGEVAISVSDNGFGIERHLLPDVFEMFFQAGSTSRLAAGGLGIGLALARQLVELHGGTIEASSEGPGRGSEFTVRLPLSVSPQAAQETKRAPAPEGGRRVLVVDDNVDAAESLGLLLRKMGHAVQVSYDGAAALEAALREPPEIVLLDLDIPKLDGFAVVARLREDRRFDRVPIVALTGFGQEVDRQRARQAGFDEHMLKPIDSGALRAALDLVRGGSGRAPAPAPRTPVAPAAIHDH